jgi:hypothetical protein
MNQLPEGFALKEKVASLSQLILAKHPQMPVLLQEIHTALTKQPENVLLLSEEDIAVIISGLEVQTSTSLMTAATSTSKVSLKKALQTASSVDLFGL